MADTNPTLPTNRLELDAYVRALLPVWTQNAAALNLSSDQVFLLGEALTASTAGNQDQIDAAGAARAATATAVDLSDTLRRVVLSSLKTIRGTATLSNTPASVYRLAQIPAPSSGSPVPAPLAPKAVNATLGTSGAVTVTWSGSVAQTSFQVQRQLTGADGVQTPFKDLPYDGNRPYTDTTLPVGTREATYTVRALRGGKTSPWSFPSTLRFVAGDEAVPLRLAA